MPTSDQTLNEILNLAATHFKVPREKLTPDDDFFKTLGIDSLQALDLLTETGESFPRRAAGLRTAGRLGFPDAGEPNSIAAVTSPRAHGDTETPKNSMAEYSTCSGSRFLW